MSSLKLFGALLEHGVMHTKEMTSTSINPAVSSTHDLAVHGLDNDRRSVHSEESQEPITKDATDAAEATDHASLSSMHDAAVHGLDNDQRSVHLEETQKLIKKAATDAVEATDHANLEMGRLIRILGNLFMDNTTGHGSEFKVRLAPIANVESAALEVAKASADAALHAKLMIEAAVNSSDVLEEHAAETDLEDVRRANDLNLICKDIDLAVKGLSDALGNLFIEEPNSLKSADVVHFGPNDFEAMGVTSATLANRTNPTEDDASSAKQAELENPDSEVDRGTQNANLVQLDSNFIAERKSGNFVPTRRKRKYPSSVKDVHRKENVPCSSNTSNANEMKNLVSSTTPEKLVHFGPNDFEEATGVTSATLANRTNPTEDDASSAKQAELENPDSEVDRGTQNANLVQLNSNFIAERTSGNFVPTRRKRKIPSSVNDVHRKENIPCSSNTSNSNEMKTLVSNTSPENLVSYTPEPRRSSRKIQPTLKILEGLETECIPVESLEKCNRTQRRSNSSQVSAESKEGK